MKRTRLHFLLIACMLLAATQLFAANTKTTVKQVTTTVSLSTDVDYIISDATPFGESGVVNIVNTEHAVLILQAVKPSAAVNLLAAHVQVDGQKAVNGTNCQVKMYNRGAIILPYGNSTKPLTVYSEKNYGGTAVNDFGLENSGGYMNTLSAAKLNNQIRSFKLKRGYMVTFSTLPAGRGYSRCFIAAYNDLEVSTLPAVLDQKISSYRVFKWYDAGKKQLANYMDKDALSALNVQSSYDWGQGNSSFLPDYEWVPNHIYEDWPSSATIGGTSQSPHCKTNNEPRNPQDDHPQDLTTILNNWENMMATGLRICSPASWDGSDYWNATGFLAEFLDSIDARGWRCDIIDLHCYWPEGNFGNVNNWSNKYGRPIWISEWCWGASWNNNGAFANGVTEQDVKNALQGICTNLNNNQNVERYYYWNGERDPSRLYKNNTLTPAGQYYANMDGGLGFTGAQHTPKTPKQKAPSNFTLTYDKKTNQARLRWHDDNGEWNREMVVERSTDAGKTWESYYTVTQQETAADYSYTDQSSLDGYRYRIRIVDLNGTTRNSSVQTCVIEDATTGDAITVDGKPMYIGGNIIVNGGFDLGLQGWTNGTGQPISYPYFQVCDYNGVSGPYLTSWTSMLSNQDGSLAQGFDVLPNTQYYFSLNICNGGGNATKLDKSDGTTAFTTTATTDWQKQAGNFNTGSSTKVTFRASQMNQVQLDDFMLCRLFETRDDAMSDAVSQLQQKAQTLIDYNKEYPALNTALQDIFNESLPADLDEWVTGWQEKINETFATLRMIPSLQNLIKQAQTFIEIGLPGTDELARLVEEAQNISSTAQVANNIAQLKAQLESLPAFELVAGAVQNPTFGTSGSGWNVKTGNYQGGDQRQNNVLGKSCWNAWWATSDPNVTLGINQVISNLPEGLYLLNCLATTQHYCLSDQHAYLQAEDGEKAVSALLSYDRFDYPNVNNADAWETLTTTPIYKSADAKLTIGFESSKQGAINGAWVKPGTNKNDAKPDYREGWWCATNFQLFQLPLFRRTGEEATGWNTIILSQAYKPGKGVQLYKIAGMVTEGDQDYVCLETISEQEAGVPSVCFSETAQADFFVSGEAVTTPKAGDNSLTGNFASDYNITKVPTSKIGSLVLIDGGWYELEADDMPYTMQKGHAYISGGRKKLTVLSAWDGKKLPIVSTLSGIVATTNDANTTQQVFTLDGRKANGTKTRGIKIQKQGRNIRKTF